MLPSLLLGIVAGARSMTPLAAVANAARTGKLPRDNNAPDWLAHPLASAATTALAAYELAGDKQHSAPDRIIPPAVVIRSLNAAFAGAVVAPREDRWKAAVLTGAVAVVASYLTWHARMKAMETHSQEITGLIEDAIVLPTAIAAATARQDS
ncbi:DUF4126 family protein [Sphingomonas turrisvirgatae]|uniref:DUF4126 domain-containing protein n=1 Tax=Sphingomonas turrisvirgatae TaxID=1888892 RepID=A0A1E3LUX2_9SPHN|nr:DUF4126 family protein [Sphingomonas turrisvirgatae]ODP37562.1 DUF4126 domain-containing protein [Sphingomonas turrisvirgatae]